MIESWTMALLAGLLSGAALGFAGGVLLTRKNACWIVEEVMARMAPSAWLGAKTSRKICSRIQHIPEPIYMLSHPRHTPYNPR